MSNQNETPKACENDKIPTLEELQIYTTQVLAGLARKQWEQAAPPKPIMATDVMKRIEALELGYQDAKATNAEIQDDVDRIDGAVAELLEWCKRLSREQTAEPATKAETQPTIVGPKREAVELTAQQGFDCWHMLSNCASGEEPGAIQAWLAKNSLRLVRDTPSEAETRHYHPRLPGFGYDGKIARVIRCSGCGEMLTGLADSRWRVAGDRWEHQCGDVQAGHHEARDFGPIVETQPALQWVDWKEGMVIEEGLYLVVHGTDTWVSTRTFRNGQWQWPDGLPCGPYISRYLPVRLPDPFAKQ